MKAVVGSVDVRGVSIVLPSAIQEEVQSAIKYIKEDRKIGEHEAACNIGVSHAFHQLTGNAELNGKKANQMLDTIHHSSDWAEIPMSEAQEIVNSGGIVIAGKKEAKHGHIVLVVPGEEFQSTDWEGPVPVVMDTGEQGKWASRGVSYSWNKYVKDEVQFFVYHGPIHK